MSPRARDFIQHDDSYLRETLKPLYCLVFILPMLVLFHCWNPSYRLGLLAEHDMRKVLSYFGGTAVCLPPLAVVSVLLGQHLLRRDRWELRPRVLGGMCVESVLWIAPLIAVSHITSRIFLTATQPASSSMDSVLIGVGGGIYEEFIFHLLGIGIILLIFIDGFSLPKVPVAVFAVAVIAILFGLFHMNVPPFYGSEAFSGKAFAFRIAAGLYLGALFILRGFGIAVGTHVMWNIYVCLM